jgi:hypothetical protein
LTAGAPLDDIFTVDLLAESFNCRPSEVRDEDEVDIALRILRLKMREQVKREQEYFASA